MTEASFSFFNNITSKIISADKEKLGSYVNEIWEIMKNYEIDDYFEKLCLLGLGTQLALFTKHYREERLQKELSHLIAEHGKDYFDENMNHIIDMAESGLESRGNNLSLMDEINFSETFLTDFCSYNYNNYRQIVSNLHSIKSGHFNQENITVSFALYFYILGMFYDFPDNDVYALINLLNYYILVPEKDRHDRINLEMERSFSLYIKLDFSERRYLYTDLPFIYSKLAEKKEQIPNKGEFTIVSKNSDPIKFNIKSGIRSEIQTVSRSLEILIALENILNHNEKTEMRLVLFERVFYNRRRLEQENTKKERELSLMLNTPYGFYIVPENSKLHHETAFSLFTKAVSLFKTINEVNPLETGKNLFGQNSIYQGALNLEHGVAICLYMLLKEMSFDDVKKIFSDTKDTDQIFQLKKHLLQDTDINEIKIIEKTDFNKTTLLEQMLFFMYWEICGYSNQESKVKENPVETQIKNPNVFNNTQINFENAFHPFMHQSIEVDGLSFKQLVEFREPFWWKKVSEILLPNLNWNAFESHFYSENDNAFSEEMLDISKIKDTSLLIELLFRFSRIEPEFKENIIAMLNHLREAQKEVFPIYYDSKTEGYNSEALENQKKIQSIDSGFWIASIYQSIFPFNTEEAISKYKKEETLCRYIINCKLFQESDAVLITDDKNRIRQNFRETNKIAMYTRYLYLDRNIYVHEGSSRTIKELLKPNKIKDLLITLSDFLTYLDSDSERYKDNSLQKGFASVPLSYDKCLNYIKKECCTLTSLIMKIYDYEANEITSSSIEEFSKSLPQSTKMDYHCEQAKNEFLKERLERLLNIIFLSTKQDFDSNSIDFLIEYKRQILLYIISVTFKLVHEINKVEE